ncbi:MAG: PAS domain-containing protein [Dongiaceae bacterium]
MSGTFSDKRIGISEVRYDLIVGVASYLDRKRGARPFPARADVVPEDLHFALGKIILVDVRYDPLDFVFRLYGSEIAAMDRDEVTGKSVRDIGPAAYRDMLVRHYTDAVTERVPLFHEIVATADGASDNYQRAIIPLSDDGVVINILLTVAGWNDDLHRIWPKVLVLD